MRRIAPLLVAVALVASGCSPDRDATPAPKDTYAPAARIAAVGDIGTGSKEQADLAGVIAAEHRRKPIEALVLLGDIIYPDGDYREYTEKFADPYASVIEEGIPFVPALGNHDVMTDTERFMEAFGMKERYYTVRRGPVEILVIDNSSASVTQRQLVWIEQQLKASTAQWIIPVMHVPLYSSGKHGSNKALQRALEPLFIEYGVRLVLAGHDHNYERTKQIKGITYIVSGGGCCVRKISPSSISIVAESRLHFVTIEATRTELTLSAIGSNGEAFDSVRLTTDEASAAA